jgi:cell division protein FtsL
MLCRPNNKNKNNKKTLYSLRILTFATLILVGLAYVWQISQVSTQGYYFKDLEREISVLEKQNEKFSMEVSQLSALTRIDSEISKLGLVKNDNIVYLTDSLEIVARNK